MLADPGPGCAPMHGSFEDRPQAPDAVFASVGARALETAVTAWGRELLRAGAAQADVLHLHHLTPLNEAVARVAPDTPVVSHLHGTELLMLEQIGAGPPPGWRHAARWRQRLRDWAQGCTLLTVATADGALRAERLLGLDPRRLRVVPNGFDAEIFHPTDRDRAAHWSEHLVRRPRGSRAGAEAGSVSYDASEVAAMSERPVLLYAGRFTEVKRVPLMIEAFARARGSFERGASLVLVGGHPGEWEGEHPIEAVERLGVQDVYLAGWHDHDALPAFMQSADALVLPSVREQFGQVVVEAMGCGLPPIAVDRFGPSEIVEDGRTGWLVAPDDREALTRAMIEAVNDPEERRRRAAAAAADAHHSWSWAAAAETLAGVLDEALAARPPRRYAA